WQSCRGAGMSFAACVSRLRITAIAASGMTESCFQSEATVVRTFHPSFWVDKGVTLDPVIPGPTKSEPGIHGKVAVVLE
ncbi:MAG: hypothetical protein L0H70_00400, partial [Xanthomonadales bacterium]|nr:hypothetical protein [Xanthomonadales bacterium]